VDVDVDVDVDVETIRHRPGACHLIAATTDDTVLELSTRAIPPGKVVDFGRRPIAELADSKW
jgi:hypothetical protein